MAGIVPLSVPYVEGGLPPQNIWKTSDSYTTPTDMYFTIRSQKIISQGHPYWGNDTMPLNSPNQWRVMCLDLPDPNSFNIAQEGIALKSKKYLWQLKGFRINMDGEIGNSVETNVHFDPEYDTSDPPVAKNFTNLSYTPPLQQTICVGCRPAYGVYFTPRDFDNGNEADFIPEVKEIHDGDLIPVGFGNVNINPLLESGKKQYLNGKDYYPAIMALNPQNIPKVLAEIDMAMEDTGDRDFIIVKREQVFSQSIVQSKRPNQDRPPDAEDWLYKANWSIPSGSVISSLNDIYNKTYWVNRGEHQNNCLAWDDKFYFTFCDNYRARSFVLPVWNQAGDVDKGPKLALRYIRQFQVEAIVRLVEVTLEAELIQYLYRINRQLVEKWGYGWSSFKNPSNSTFFQNHVKNEEEEYSREPEVNCLYFDMTGHVSSDMGSTKIGRHFKSIMSPEEIEVAKKLENNKTKGQRAPSSKRPRTRK